MKPKEQKVTKGGRNGQTKRQTQIFHLLANGGTDKEMAGAIGISEETIAYHLRVMYRQHGVPSRAALVAKLKSLSESK